MKGIANKKENIYKKRKEKKQACLAVRNENESGRRYVGEG